MARRINKRKLAKFNRVAEREILRIGGVLKDSFTFDTGRTSKTWTVDTKAGKARVSLFGDGFEIYIKFEDVERAKANPYFSNCNPYSGKWNHYFEPDAIPALERILSLLEVDPAQKFFDDHFVFCHIG